MRTLEDFKITMLGMLDNNGYQAVATVLSEIEVSGFNYPKADFANLWHDGYAKLTALDPNPYITRLKVFVGSLSGKYNKKLRYEKPYKPSYFIGREKKLKELHKKLTGSGQRGNILLLNGIGGIGKTTILHEYLNQVNCLEHFSGIVAISVNKNLQSAFISGMAAVFEIDMRTFIAREEALLREILKRMRQHPGNNLLAVDNINESDYDDLIAMKAHFIHSGWKVIITTRTAPHDFAALRVDELDMEESIILFAHHYAPEQVDASDTKALLKYVAGANIKKDIKKLLEHIVQHTLLTELLAKVGRVKGYTVNKLLTLMREQDSKILDTKKVITVGSHANNTFRQELNRSYLEIYMLNLFETEYLIKQSGDHKKDKENAAKATMLRFFSVLPAQDIPIADLKKLWRVGKVHEDVFEDRLDDVMQMGWIQGKQRLVHIDDNTQNLFYKMHPLVQEVVYKKLSPDIDTCRPLVRTISEILAKPLTYPQAYQNYAKSVVDNLKMLSHQTTKS